VVCQLTRIDGQYFLESISNSVVFVNDVRVQFKMLNQGARITLGGVGKTYQEGSKFPAVHTTGPHVVYEYHVAKDYSVPDVYQDPLFRSDELISFDEFVGGRYLKEFYHAEDFNMTEVLAQALFSADVRRTAAEL